MFFSEIGGVMSSAKALDPKDGKVHATGYYLNEFVIPYQQLVGGRVPNCRLYDI